MWMPSLLFSQPTDLSGKKIFQFYTNASFAEGLNAEMDLDQTELFFWWD
jgi:hypothetical protein